MTGTFVPLKGRMKFLTFWDMVSQTLLLTITQLKSHVDPFSTVEIQQVVKFTIKL